jgi:hypothetical protein
MQTSNENTYVKTEVVPKEEQPKIVQTQIIEVVKDKPLPTQTEAI